MSDKEKAPMTETEAWQAGALDRFKRAALRLHSVAHFIDALGPWPKTDEEWQTAWELWKER